MFGFGPSPDLIAIWLAGHFPGTGDLAQVYSDYDRVYTMRPPAGWGP